MPAKTWILLDGITKIQSQPLQTEQLQLAILKMSSRDWTRFYVWTPGWKNWQRLKDFLNSEQVEFSLPGAPLSEENVKNYIQEQIDPRKKRIQEQDTVTKTQAEKSITKSVTTINAREETLTPASHDFSGDNLSSQLNDRPPEPLSFKRVREGYETRSVRHELKLEILLSTSKGKTFKSFSRNISLSGTLLEDNVPFDFYGTQFDIIVINRNSLNPQTSRVQMRGETVGDGLTQRLRFVGQSEGQKEKLMTLLNDYIAQQNLAKKSS